MENNKDGILLETGTNEIEIMEFTIDGNLYGINVAKVREIMLSAPVHPMPHAHPAVEGIFKPRDIVITVVDLPEYLSGHTEPKGEKDLFIITNFNKMHIAFRVHTVVGDQPYLVAGHPEAGQHGFRGRRRGCHRNRSVRQGLGHDSGF